MGSKPPLSFRATSCTQWHDAVDKLVLSDVQPLTRPSTMDLIDEL